MALIASHIKFSRFCSNCWFSFSLQKRNTISHPYRILIRDSCTSSASAARTAWTAPWTHPSPLECACPSALAPCIWKTRKQIKWKNHPTNQNADPQSITLSMASLYVRWALETWMQDMSTASLWKKLKKKHYAPHSSSLSWQHLLLSPASFGNGP